MTVVDAGGLTKNAAGVLAKAIESHTTSARPIDGWRVARPAKQHGTTAELTVETRGRRVQFFFDGSGAAAPSGQASVGDRPADGSGGAYSHEQAAWDARAFLVAALPACGWRVCASSEDGGQVAVVSPAGDRATITIHKGG